MTKHTQEQDAVRQALAPLQAAHEKAMLRLHREHERAAKRRQRVEQRLDDKFNTLKQRLASHPDPGALPVNTGNVRSRGVLGALRSMLL
ncbi:hypothetical protein [Oleidesulfovibrio sp.]|uniref:hypothetical protein n=1 Tax=Oleidesulfovibrio sp. TaxID=2909707 RepID=UPI003A879E60